MDYFALQRYFLLPGSIDSRLLFFVQQGKLSRVKYLVEKGANIFIKTIEKETLLHLAAINGEILLMEFLISEGLCIQSESSQGETPLHYAVIGQHKKAIKYLLERGASLVQENRFGDTVIHIAAEMGKVSLVSLLLTDHWDLINIQNTYSGYMPLHEAVENGNVEVIVWLINHGADLNAKIARKALTPLLLAVCYTKAPANKIIVDLLLKKGANLDDKDLQGNTALHIATQQGKLEIIKSLLNYPVNIYATNKVRENILHIAVQNGNSRIIKILLLADKENVNLNKYDAIGLTPLHIAILNGYPSTIVCLIQADADVNQLTAYQDSALHMAVRSQQLEIVRLLLKRSAFHLYTKGHFNNTPLEEAILYKYWDILNLLLTANSLDKAPPFFTEVLAEEKLLIRKKLTLFLTNQLIKINISKKFGLSHQSNSIGKEVAVDIWWKLPLSYRSILLILARCFPDLRHNKQKIYFSYLPLEMRQIVAYYVCENYFYTSPRFAMYFDPSHLLKYIGILLELLASLPNPLAEYHQLQNELGKNRFLTSSISRTTQKNLQTMKEELIIRHTAEMQAEAIMKLHF